MGVQFYNDNNKELIKEAPCFRNLNLLAHAQIEEMEIGSRCGGHGICGGDRVKIISNAADLSPLTSDEKIQLSIKEITEGWRLACQCWPNKDDLNIQIAVPNFKK